MTGLFVTFEGPDGSGKSTQIRKVAQWLSGAGVRVLLTREPGGTAIGDRIRQLLLDPGAATMDPVTEVLLYAASRSQHVQEVIRPALQEGRWVLCDRFTDASIAYQAYGLGVPRRWVEEVNRFATQGLRPHRTYLLDVDPEEGRRRLEGRRVAQGGEALDRIEGRDLAYHARVREAFLRLAEEEPQRFCLVDARQGEEEVFRQIQADLKDFLERFPRR